MRLKAKFLDLDAAGKMICVLNEKDAQYMGLYPLDRVVVKYGDKKMTGVVNTASAYIKEGEIGVYTELKEALGLKGNVFLETEPREELMSKSYIRKKVENRELNYKEYEAIVEDVLNRNLNDLQLASFITGLKIHGLSVKEVGYLTKAMVNTGEVVKFKGPVLDKHSIGGIPGDKTTLVLVPIIASLGYTIPKTSSRSITDPAGTGDRMEVLSCVEFTTKDIKKLVKKAGGCIVWGGSLDIAPADDLFIEIEHPLDYDPLLLPSVLSKKKATGSNYIVIDIPYGKWAKVENRKEGEKLGVKFNKVGKSLDMEVDYVLTEAKEPLGYGIGPALEAREALEMLMWPEKGPKDLYDKVVKLSSKLLDMVGKSEGEKDIKKALKSGRAEKKFRQIMGAQGGSKNIKPKDIEVGGFGYKVQAKHKGIIKEVDNDKIRKIGKCAGAPKDKGAGILLNKKLGDDVEKDELLYTIYAENKEKLNKAVSLFDRVVKLG